MGFNIFDYIWWPDPPMKIFFVVMCCNGGILKLLLLADQEWYAGAYLLFCCYAVWWYSFWYQNLYKAWALRPRKWINVNYIGKEQITHDSWNFRFAFDGYHLVLGLPIGKHIRMKGRDENGEEIIRTYTPVSDPQCKGMFTCLIKVYKDGKFTQWLDKLEPGAKVPVMGPTGHIKMGGAKCILQKTIKKRETIKFKRLNLIAGGTGITPMWQVLKGITRRKGKDQTQVSMIFANRTANDILMQESLELLHKKIPGGFFLHYTISGDVPKDWEGSVGRVDSDMCKEYLYPGGDDTLTLLCGPAGMTRSCEKFLKELGHDSNRVLTL